MLTLYSPLFLVFILSAILNLSLALYGWHCRHVTGAVAFSLAMFMFALLPLAQAINLASSDLAIKVITLKSRVEAAGIGASAWMVMALQLMGYGHLVNRRTVAALIVVPLTILVLNWTENPWFRSGYFLDFASPKPVLHWTTGPLFWLGLIYLNALLVLPLVLVWRSYRHISLLSFRQTLALTASILLPLVVNLFFQLVPGPAINFPFAAGPVMGLIVAGAFFRYRLFNVVPIARGLLVEGMNDGVLVLDVQDRIVDLNTAAQRIIGTTVAQALGRDVGAIFVAWPDLLARLRQVSNLQTEIQASEDPPRYFDLRLSPLVDRRGQRIGRLIVVRDITEHKQAEASRAQAEAERQAARVRQQLLDFSGELLSTLNLDETLEIIRRTANRLVPHDTFAPYWVDETAEVLRPIETGDRQWYSHPTMQTWMIPFRRGILGNAALTRQAECVNDAHLDPRSIYPPGRREQIDHEHLLALPLRSREKMIGLVALSRVMLSPFTRDEFELAQLLMSQAALALDNARLFAELEQRVVERTAELRHQNQYLNTLHEITLDLLNQRSLDDLLLAILGSATQLIEATHGYIGLVEGDTLIDWAVSPRENAYQKKVWHRGESGGPLSQVLQSRQPLIADDYSALPGLRPETAALGMHAAILMPILAGGVCLGILGVFRNRADYPFTSDQVYTLGLLAQLAALALDNAQLNASAQRELAERKRVEEDLRQQSIRDPLTGLFNRRYLEETLTRELNRAARAKHSLGLIMLDLDHFKHFNDTFGHDVGDALLRGLGSLLKAQIRDSDIACRYGGEEFILILPEASLETTRQRAEAIQASARQLLVQHLGQPLGGITLSIGLATYPDHGLNGEALVKAADVALYRAKQAGRDRVVVSGE